MIAKQEKFENPGRSTNERTLIEKAMLNYSIQALIGTGDFIMKYKEYNHTRIITKINNPKYRKALEGLINKFESKKYNVSSSELVYVDLAKLALGDLTPTYNLKKLQKNIQEAQESERQQQLQYDSFGLTQAERNNPLVQRLVYELNWNDFYQKTNYIGNKTKQQYLLDAKKDLDQNHTSNALRLLQLALASDPQLTHERVKQLPSN